MLMTGYFIKYVDRVIIVESNGNLLYKTHEHYLLPIEEDLNQYEIVRKRYPYANYVKIDLHEQLYKKNLRRTLPKKIMNIVLSIPEVKNILRNEKINSILDE
jgi:hypothetical protein